MPSTGRVEDKVKPAFGQVVWFKTKGYVGVKEKKADAAENPDLPPRWKKGFYRGRAPDVPGGHIICRSDGGLVIAKGIRDRVITPSPHVLPELEAHELARRITGKTTPPGRDGTPPGRDGTVAVAVLGATTRQTMVDEILGHPKVESSAKELREMPESKDQDGSLQRSLGAFQHGSVVGLSTLSRSHPELVQKVCQLILRDHPHHTFTSVTLSRNTHAPFPKDCPSDPNSVNLVSPLQVPSEGQGGMWVELECGDSVVSGAFGHRNINDKDIPVNSMDLRSPVRFNPNRKYGLEEGDKGSKDRIIVVAHTMQGWRKLKPAQREALTRLGFNLPPNPPLTGEEPKLRALRALREEPESPQPPMRVPVRWGRVFRELMYATGQWNRPDYTRALDIAVASIAREEEQERPAEATHREVESAATHREAESTTPVSPESRESSELGSHVHDVGELAERLAEALGIEVTSSDEEFERVHDFFGDTPGVADEAYRAQLVEERVRAWANARPRTHPNLPGSLNREGLTMAEVHAVEMMIGFYRETAQRPLSRESTPSPPPTGFPSLRMMSVGPPSSEEPQAAFEVLEPSEVERIRVEELHHQSEVSEPQLTQACALRKAEALYTPDVEGLLAKA